MKGGIANKDTNPAESSFIIDDNARNVKGCSGASEQGDDQCCVSYGRHAAVPWDTGVVGLAG